MFDERRAAPVLKLRTLEPAQREEPARVLMNLWTTIVTGGLSGAATTIIFQLLREWWKRPILKILFDEGVDGCRIETDALGSTHPIAWFLRLKIQNQGNSMAKDVSLIVIRLGFEASDSGLTTFAEEVLDLKLSSRPAQTVFRLARGAHQYVDLTHTLNAEHGVEALFDFVNIPLRLRRLGFRQGTYYAEVLAAADNADCVKRTISWTWDGRYEGLRIPALTQAQVSLIATQKLASSAARRKHSES